MVDPGSSLPAGGPLGPLEGKVVTPGLVPGPPGPNIGEFEEDGELDEDGGLDIVGWEELVSLPPQPVAATEAHTRYRQARTVGNRLAITAFDAEKCAYLHGERM